MSLKRAYSNENKMASSANFSNGGETEYPATLQELVLNYLCKNLDEICVTKPVITTPKRRRVHSGPNHCFASEMDLDDELQLLERVSGQNTNSYTDEVRAENLQERGKLSIISAKYILSFWVFIYYSFELNSDPGFVLILFDLL